MNNSVFDADSFLQSTITAVTSTARPPIPVGEYNAMVKSVAIRTPKTSVILDVTWIIDDEAARKATGVAEPTVRQSLFLDINEQGQLDSGDGKNLQLGRLRTAVGQNTTAAWAPSRLEGAMAKVSVTQRANENDTSIIYNDVKSVTKR
jgi:hypothetical protein